MKAQTHKQRRTATEELPWNERSEGKLMWGWVRGGRLGGWGSLNRFHSKPVSGKIRNLSSVFRVPISIGQWLVKVKRMSARSAQRLLNLPRYAAVSYYSVSETHWRKFTGGSGSCPHTEYGHFLILELASNLCLGNYMSDFCLTISRDIRNVYA